MPEPVADQASESPEPEPHNTGPNSGVPESGIPGSGIPDSETSEIIYKPIRQVGRYELFEEIASGGFAAVHLGRTLGAGGFSRTVAIKRLHPQFAKDPNVVAMFLDEARIVARIRHPNVLPTIDFVQGKGELMIVMEYVEGVTLGHLLSRASRLKGRLPVGVALRVICGALHGLQAAHNAKNAKGEPLGLIHRDVTPDNIMVGTDGLPRLLDFGVARAMGGFHSTRDGEVKGKLSYLAPEQVMGDEMDQRTDVYSASVVLWESLVGRKLFRVKSLAHVAKMVLDQEINPPSAYTEVPRGVDEIVMRGLAREPDDRFQSAGEMAKALERIRTISSTSTVAQYVSRAGKKRLELRASQVGAVENTPLGLLLEEVSADDTGEHTIMSLMSMDRASMPDIPPEMRTIPPPRAKTTSTASQEDTVVEPSSRRGDTLADAASSRDNTRDSEVSGQLAPSGLRRAFIAAGVMLVGLVGLLLMLGPDSGAPLKQSLSPMSDAAHEQAAGMSSTLNKPLPPKPAPAPEPVASAEPSATASASVSAAPPVAPSPSPVGIRPNPRPWPKPAGGSGLYGRE